MEATATRTTRTTDVVQACLDAIKEPISDTDFGTLSLLFDEKTLVAALEIIDRHRVVKFEFNGRKYHLIKSSRPTMVPYTTFAMSDLAMSSCSCPAFQYSVLVKRDQFVCKHILAIRLAEQLGVCRLEQADIDSPLVAALVAD